MRWKLFFILFFSLSILLFAGCVTEPEEVESSNTGDPVFSPNAKVLDHIGNVSITSVTEDEVVVSFTGDAPDIEVDDFIISSLYTSEYFGFLRKVTSKSVSGSTITYQTTDARLTDAVRECSADTTLYISPGKSKNSQYTRIEAMDGVTSTDFGLDLSGVVLYDGEIGGAELSVIITHGYVSFEPGLDIGFDIDWWEIEEFHAIASGDFDLDVDLKAELLGNLNYSADTTLYSYTEVFIQWIGWFPVVEVVTLSFDAGFEINAISDNILTTGFDHNTYIALGAQYDNGYWSSVWDFNVTQNAHPTTWISSSKFEIRGYVQPRVSVDFYGIAGPYMEAEPYLGFLGELEMGGGWDGPPPFVEIIHSPQDWYEYYWQLYAGITGRLGFQVSVLGYTICDYYTTLMDWYLTIAEGSGSSGGGGGDIYSCYEIQGQQPSSPFEGEEVVVTGVVTTGYGEYWGEDLVIMSDRDGGAWGSLPVRGSQISSLNRGDVINISGTVYETNGMTELLNITAVELLAYGADLPDPIIVLTNEIGQGSNPERLESVLVRVEEAIVTDITPCLLDDGSGECMMGDMGSYSWNPAIDDTLFTGKGPLFYTSGEWKFEPRNNSDVYASGSGGGCSPYPDSLIATVTLSAAPQDICASPDGNYVYATTTYPRNMVSRINTLTNSVETSVMVGSEPRAICTVPSGEYLYTANHNSGTVSVIRTSDFKIVKTISVGGTPQGICSVRDGAYVYVTRSDAGTVQVIQTSDNSVVASVDVGDSPVNICSVPGKNVAYVANYDSDDVSVIRTTDHCMIRTVNLGLEPFNLCSSPDGEKVYITRMGSDRVGIIDTSNYTVSSITLESGLRGICVLADGKYLYVTSCLFDDLWVIDLSDNTVVRTIRGYGDYPWSVCSLPSGDAVYVTNNYDRTVSVYK